MKKIVYLPLDDRPCNAKFPSDLFDSDQMRIVCCDALGDYKTPADADAVEAFLRRECRDADGLVLSLDLLLYGGLAPSRIHTLSNAELERRLGLLRDLRNENPALRILAFQCIMRCPTYASNSEEPDYYATYGVEIHAIGVARHRLQNGEEAVRAEVERLEAIIPAEALENYLGRRSQNLGFNLRALELVESGDIEFLVFPQDDAAPLGFTAMDQARVRLAVREKRLQHKAFVYPGADELGMTLLARMKNELEGRCPSVYVHYAALQAAGMVPLLEDRPLAETIRYQLLAAGCRMAFDPEKADFILSVTAPPANMAETSMQPRLDLDYDVGRSLPAFVAELEEWIHEGKAVSICDNAYVNGGDLELLSLLDQRGLLLRVAGYSGWNTSANTLGTAIAEGVRYLYEGADERFLNFLVLRYLEDCGYDSVVRKAVTSQDLPGLGLDYFHVREEEGAAAACVKKRLVEFVCERMPSVASRIEIGRVTLPWRRMFEPDIEAHYLMK